ncbi:MAG: FAD-dependent oxidoreductase [Solirubrobacterales bacterium]|nr:FAD-dependent oxidoreductase [Solirubrobacterales bacterium]
MVDGGQGPDLAHCDLAIVGGGAAGLWAALCAAEAGGTVCLISRKPLAESASFHAQGGLAAALDPEDSPARHAAETITAGRGLCRTAAVEILTEEAPGIVNDLIERGMRFDRETDGSLSLALEGGHSVRRIIHAGGSQTGREITGALARLVAAESRIEVIEETSATSLWSDGNRCHGVITDRGRVRARATLLATGGAAALWRRTSNPWGAIGAGPVLASAAGAELADLEFCQFHPTCLSAPDTPFDGALITEAIRGEGATLLDNSGQRFTDELAPRDDVTAAILDRADRTGGEIRLDLREVSRGRFPSVFELLERAGLDPERSPVPISPGAHYMMGGIAVDLNGMTTVDGLYAAGECACTGLHGANRLASNSLTECFVFGRRAARAALAERSDGPPPPVPGWEFGPPTIEDRADVWRFAGPLRDRAGLAHLAQNRYPLARAIGATAASREESRGGHRRRDFPGTDPALDGIHLIWLPDGEIETRRWE